MDNFTVNYNSSTSTFTFTDPSGGVINAKEIETFSFGGKSYVHYTGDGGTNINDNVYGFWSESENLLVSYGNSQTFLDNYDQTNHTLSGHSKNENLTIKGSSNGISMNLGSFGNSNNANDFSGTLTVKLGSGADYMSWYAGTDSTDHSIDLGAGDDIIYITTDANALRFSKLDGGAGSDTVKFEGTNTIPLTLTTAGAVNFENIRGGGGNDNISGDNNANILTGSNGADNISGYGGNDILGGHNAGVSNGDDDNDILYGGAGNDILYGTAGANMMDGGTGQDNMSGGNGNDTFIIRSGDGGSALTDADIIMDFQDGTDVIGLSGGLNFDDLTIAQGSGSNSSHTTIRITSSGEYLAILQNVSVSNISVGDFTTVN
jgi:Ca2+-binding RTX toxin-like protein